MNWLTIAAASIISGILGAMGLGGGGVLIIYLTLFTDTPQAMAQGINLLFFIPTAVLAVIIYLKKGLISIKLALLAVVFGLFGAFLGNYLGSLFDNRILSKLFGGLLIIMALTQLFHKKDDTKDSEM